jgi:hypothetical protein
MSLAQHHLPKKQLRSKNNDNLCGLLSPHVRAKASQCSMKCTDGVIRSSPIPLILNTTLEILVRLVIKHGNVKSIIYGIL